jgi:DNA-binding CsgD family transcriptional regulator
MTGMGDMLCPVVVGRDGELAALVSELAASLAGAGRAVCITGEPGIGKSRLAREVAARARVNGAMVVVGRAVPAGAATPYRPLTEALLQAVRDRPLPPDHGLAPWLPALAAITPALGEPGPGHPALSGEVSVAVRGEALVRLLGLLSRPAGLVMVLEDLHWADPDTLALVEYLADNLSGQPVLCVATSRSEPPSAATAAIARLHSRRAARHLPLARLDGAAVEAMVRACLPGASDEVIARVWRSADGVPFLVEEVLASPGVPESFRESVQARLAELTGTERLVLQAAATLGRHFDWRLLPVVAGQPADEVGRALDQGVRHLLLTVDGDDFAFRHALTREAVAGSALPPRRSALAATALAAVEAAHPGLPGPWHDMAAELAARAGHSERAGALLAESGTSALARGALATAVDTLRRAVVVMKPGPARVSVQEDLVEALALAGRVDEALSMGVDLIAALGEQEAGARATARVHIRLAQAAVAATRWPVATSHLTAAWAMLETVHDPALAARARVLAAEVALADDDADRARDLARATLASDGATPEIRCHALEVIGRSARLRDLDAAREAFEQELQVAQSAALPLWRLRATHELGTIDLYHHAGTRRLLEARQMAADLGALSTTAVLGLQLAAVYDSRFEPDLAYAHARESLDISERLGLDDVRTKALLFLSESSALRLDGEASERYLLLALASSRDPVTEAFGWGGSRAMRALLDGDQPAAMRAFDHSAAILRASPPAEPANFRGVWLVLLAAIDDPAAEPELASAHRAGVTAAFANRGMAGFAEAILAGRRGEHAKAAGLAASAEADLAPYPVWMDLAKMLAAEAALADGWGSPQQWLASARATFAGRGFHRLAQRCDAALSGPAPERWSGLGVTAREADVLRLVAEGLANKDIATRLFVSPRTVEKHVESLLRKTGARSRTQLVAIAGPPPPPG